MRRFLRPTGGGKGPRLVHHKAGQFGGSVYLPDGEGNAFRPLGPNNIVVGTWVMLGAKGVFQKLLAVADAPAGSAATDIYELQYDATDDTFAAVMSNGTAYKSVFPTGPTISPVVGKWYYLQATFAGSAFELQIADTSGDLAGGSTATLAGGYNSPTSAFLGVGASHDGVSILQAGGALDSAMLWNSVDTSVYGGFFDTIRTAKKALDYSEMIALGTNPPLSELQIWLDFNEPTGAVRYHDRSPNARILTPGGSGVITRINGAGY